MRGRRATLERAATVAAGLLALCLGAGCGAGSPSPADDLALAGLDDAFAPLDLGAQPEGDLLASAFDLARPVDLVPPYPPGPYGAEVGDVPPNFTWKGYLDLTGEWPADKLPLTDVSLQQLRLANGRYLFMATGAYW